MAGEIRPRRGFHAIRAVPKINLVQVKLENLLFGVIALQLQGEEELAKLAREGFFMREEQHL